MLLPETQKLLYVEWFFFYKKNHDGGGLGIVNSTSNLGGGDLGVSLVHDSSLHDNLGL